MTITGTRPDGLTALSLPPVGTDRLLVSSSGVLKRADLQRAHGGLWTRKPIIKPGSSDFGTWLNQASATLTDNGDALSLTYGNGVTTGTSLTGRYRNLPSGDWDVQLGTMRMYNPKEYLLSGIMLYESGTGKLETFGHGHGSSDAGIMCSRFNSTTSYNSDRRTSFEYQNPLWVRARLNAGNFRFYFSPDGVCWAEFLNLTAINNFFTTAPDKWGPCIQPVNNGGTNATGMRLDVFDWSEGSYTDIYPYFSMYENVDGIGNRTSRITCTTSMTLGGGSISNLVDDNFSNQITLPNGASSQTITFQFSEAKVITEAKWFQQATQSMGTWKWQGSNDGMSYGDISSTFTLDGNTSGSVIGDLSANATAYLYYRLQQTAGTTSNATTVREVQFKIRKG